MAAKTPPGSRPKGAKRATSFDVARLAGVSQSSVSRVFNKSWDSDIRPGTRDKVLRAAEALNYRPNAIARSLNAKRSSIIGIVVSEQFNAFYYNLLNLLTVAFQRVDMKVMVIANTPGSDLDQVIHNLRDYQVDGIVITGAALTNRISGHVLENGCPLVLVNIYSPDIPCSSVYCDNFAGSRMMAEHLYKTGCRNFVYVSAAQSRYMNHEDRQQGFLAGLAACGPHTCEVAVGDYGYESGAAAARLHLAGKARPDAFFCANEMMALGVMDVARSEFGLSIPGDISVAGFDDTFAAALPAYDLSAVQQPIEKLAEDAAFLITRQIQSGEAASHIIREPMSLVLRSSTRP